MAGQCYCATDKPGDDVPVARDFTSPTLISQLHGPVKTRGQSASISRTSSGLRKTMASKATGSANITKLLVTQSCITASNDESTHAHLQRQGTARFASRKRLYLEFFGALAKLASIVHE